MHLIGINSLAKRASQQILSMQVMELVYGLSCRSGIHFEVQIYLKFDRSVIKTITKRFQGTMNTKSVCQVFVQVGPDKHVE